MPPSSASSVPGNTTSRWRAAQEKKPLTRASSLFHVDAATRGPAGSNRRQCRNAE